MERWRVRDCRPPARGTVLGKFRGAELDRTVSAKCSALLWKVGLNYNICTELQLVCRRTAICITWLTAICLIATVSFAVKSYSLRSALRRLLLRLFLYVLCLLCLLCSACSALLPSPLLCDDMLCYEMLCWDML